MLRDKHFYMKKYMYFLEMSPYKRNSYRANYRAVEKIYPLLAILISLLSIMLKDLPAAIGAYASKQHPDMSVAVLNEVMDYAYNWETFFILILIVLALYITSIVSKNIFCLSIIEDIDKELSEKNTIGK